MKQVIARFIAVLLLVIPGLGATYGFLLMKDAVFHYFASFGDESASRSFEWWSFAGGMLLFLLGVGFIGGWTFFRDRKRNYISPRFRGKRQRPPRPGAG
ncbi:DUF2627 domain-containing protein [Paenibacillus sp. sptzw28]|uniref:DUF2627 domain-containing protein n=1 Tax=Paenibacillus sp. sptzw28 TaxID=715179 RepID=UPI001C6E8139|nr:DUF2627 domain-containing protein [Paenibacillus sp. sptzw28]QYR19985.1 DUF2627 domain-containing protein [Paenibacillus sp. sptzw28]